jgi:opacity protein-like surface antigen
VILNNADDWVRISSAADVEVAMKPYTPFALFRGRSSGNKALSAAAVSFAIAAGATTFDTAIADVTIAGVGYGNGSGSNNGWTAGAGLEYAFWGTWSARVEYDFVRLNNATISVPASGPAPFSGDVISSNNRQISMLTLGLNYKFGGW